MAEELGLEQRVGNARAVDRDERAVAALALLVNQPGDDFLADAAFAGDENLCVERDAQTISVSISRMAGLEPTKLWGISIVGIRTVLMFIRPICPRVNDYLTINDQKVLFCVSL